MNDPRKLLPQSPMNVGLISGGARLACISDVTVAIRITPEVVSRPVQFILHRCGRAELDWLMLWRPFYKACPTATRVYL